MMLRAAAGVAQEPNPGMTVAATVIADVCGRWVGILSPFPPRSFLFHLFVSLLLSSSDSCLHSLTPTAAILGKRFPGASVDVCEFEVALADVLVAERGAAYWAGPMVSSEAPRVLLLPQAVRDKHLLPVQGMPQGILETSQVKALASAGHDPHATRFHHQQRLQHQSLRQR